MAVSSTAKHVYRDLKTGRLIHKRQAESSPADTWTKEVFVPPTGFEPPFAARGSASQPVMDVDEDHGAADGAPGS